jgi:LuxR family maltose regulon positive regulatory protein
MRDDFAHLPTAQREQALQRYQILQPFLEEHVPLTQVIQTHQLPLRTARRWVQQYRETGLAGLARATRADRGVRRGLPPEMEQLIAELARPEAGGLSVASLYRQVVHIASEQGWPPPGYSRVYDIVRARQAILPPEYPSPSLLTEASFALLETKLRVPRLAPDLILRERLLAQLDEGSSRTLTLVAAPAGSGKTSLVSQWIATHRASPQHPPVAWVSLDVEDNDPLRFWRYVMTACQNLLRSDPIQPALALLQAALRPPFEPSLLDEALTLFLNSLAHAPGGTLILEDYHLIHEPQIHTMLAFLIDHLPETVHLLLITRSDPPLSLARLHASGNLKEVRTDDLRFLPHEIHLFLQKTIPFPLTEEMIKQAETRLDGWAVGLRLLSIALQGQPTRQHVEQILTTFAGSSRSLQSYFVSEVLALQPEDRQDFLLRTSGLDRLSASLCQAITGRSDSDQVLKTLERAGLFLEPLDEEGRWYRYHPLFTEAMRVQARQRLGESTLRALSHRASCWFEQHRMSTRAIEAALLSDDLTRSVALIERYTTALPFQEMGEYHTLCRWLKTIPLSLLRPSPHLCLSYATALVLASTLGMLAPFRERLEELLKIAETGFRLMADRPAQGKLLALRALISWREAAISQTIALARQALALLPENERLWRGIAENFVGVQALFDGQLHLARSAFQKTPSSFICTSIVLLGWTSFEQGQLQLAAEYYRQALSEGRAANQICKSSQALLGLAKIAYEWNDLTAAEQQAQEAYELGEYLSDEKCQAQAQILLARIQHARGETASALKRLTGQLARLSPLRLPTVYREVQCEQARLQLMPGDLSTVQRWLTARVDLQNESLPLLQAEQETLLVAQLHLAHGETHEALAELAPLLDQALEAERLHSALRIQILMALAESQNRQTVEARQRLHHVLAFARIEGYQRLFLDEGEAIAALLRGIVSRASENAQRDYLQQLLWLFPPVVEIEPRIEALSPQERRVLGLLATGDSAPQIARTLIVSVNTVRTQIQSIYRKLQVNNRVEASEMARTLRIL